MFAFVVLDNAVVLAITDCLRCLIGRRRVEHENTRGLHHQSARDCFRWILNKYIYLYTRLDVADSEV